MNLKRTKGDLLLRRKRHVRTASTVINNSRWENDSINSIEKSSQQTVSEEKLNKRAELLSQLPSSTKVKTVLKVEPSETSNNNNANYENIKLKSTSISLADLNDETQRNTGRFTSVSKVIRSHYVKIC